MSALLLDSTEMARFAARGFLRFDALVPQALNEQFLADVGGFDASAAGDLRSLYGRIMASSTIPVVDAGTPLADAYPEGSALHSIMRLPEIQGLISSLVGEHPIFDHHFLHVTFPPRVSAEAGFANVSQNTHQDSTFDRRRSFDVQLFYFPHDVSREMGGTRFLPGSHLRKVSEAAIGRYQNIVGQQHVVCPAGTVIVFHHGLWHGGGVNRSDAPRFMFKIRIAPTVPQTRLWDTSDLDNRHFEQRPIFWIEPGAERDPVHAILTRPEPWFEQDTGRLEIINRIRFWRDLLGEPDFDADYWVTRVENEHL